MSEEEKKAIEHLKNYPINWELTYEVNQMAIDVILNLIEKLQKELEQEKEKNKELLYKLEVEKIDNKYNKEEAQEEMIPKYKIRAKIEELEKEKGNYDNKFIFERRIDMLKELLEE